MVLDLKINITSDAVYCHHIGGRYPCCILVASVILELHKTQLLTSAQQGVAQAPKVKAAKVRAGRLGKRERAEMKAGRGDPSSSMVLG